MKEISIEELGEFETLQTIILPLIVPSWEEVKNAKDLSFLSNSDLNACYSKPLENKKGEKRSWYEVEMAVQGEHNLPPREEWFYVVTDDGLCSFKARFEGRKVKKLCSLKHKEILGCWIKSKLTQENLVFKVDYVFEDEKRWGVVTKETLEQYGGDKLILKKTNKTKKDRNGKERDIWVLSFPWSFPGIEISYDLFEKHRAK